MSILLNELFILFLKFYLFIWLFWVFTAAQAFL